MPFNICLDIQKLDFSGEFFERTWKLLVFVRALDWTLLAVPGIKKLPQGVYSRMSISFPHVEDFLRRRVSQFYNFENEGLGTDGPFSNYNNPHFENEANCKTYLVELDINKKNILISKALQIPLRSFQTEVWLHPFRNGPLPKNGQKLFVWQQHLTYRLFIHWKVRIKLNLINITENNLIWKYTANSCAVSDYKPKRNKMSGHGS